MAHASEQVFVLLLPTDVYTAAGVAAVVATMIIASLVPFLNKANVPSPGDRPLPSQQPAGIARITRVLSLAVLLGLIAMGMLGPYGPLDNLLPLVIWTLWWLCFPVVQALIGDLWFWAMPWARQGLRTPLRLPDWVGQWPAVLGLLAFAAFLLADTSPNDPRHLALVISAYVAATLVAILLFGARQWLARGEFVTVLLSRYALLAVIARREGRLRFCWPGRQIAAMEALPLSGAVFVLVILGIGSFDGLNETFWWLAFLQVNPLEFPGRSAVVQPTLLGLLAANIALVAVFALTTWLGFAACGARDLWREGFCRLAPAILPIALGYHIAHYLTALLVEGQYLIAALSDPWHRGADYLGLGDFRVTTGFFNQLDTVRLIWLSQAGAVVVGHVWAVILGHAIALRLLRDARRAMISQLPMSIFMIGYTLFGLWLLAAPRGA
ncbi:MAG: hypothetical protein AAF415_11575 [Pseudomonadota bacterium]